jgi:plastocyanin
MFVSSPEGIRSVFDATRDRSYDAMQLSACIGRVAAVVCLGLAGNAVHADYQATEVKNGGAIAGVVRWEGEIPKRKKLPISGQDQPCHKEPIPNEDLVVSKDGKVQWVAAYLKKIEHGKPFEVDSSKPVVLDQKGCRFSPHVVVVPVRQPLRILNSDGILHNVHLHAMKNEPFNRSMPGRTTQLDVTFGYPERIRIGCDVHQWMSGWVIVAEHPYYAVTGEDGAFRFQDVPPGSYTVEIWHEKLGKREAGVTVISGEEAKIEFVLKQE